MSKLYLNKVHGGESLLSFSVSLIMRCVEEYSPAALRNQSYNESKQQ